MRPAGLVHPCWISVPTLGPWSLGLVVCSSETGLLRLGTAWRGVQRGETPDRACVTSTFTQPTRLEDLIMHLTGAYLRAPRWGAHSTCLQRSCSSFQKGAEAHPRRGNTS